MFVCTKCPYFSTLIRGRLTRHLSKAHSIEEAPQPQEDKATPEQVVSAQPEQLAQQAQPEQLVQQAKPEQPAQQAKPEQPPQQAKPKKSVSSQDSSFFDNIFDDECSEEDFRLSCDQCWFAANTQKQLDQHIQTKHPVVIEPLEEEVLILHEDSAMTTGLDPFGEDQLTVDVSDKPTETVTEPVLESDQVSII